MRAYSLTKMYIALVSLGLAFSSGLSAQTTRQNEGSTDLTGWALLRDRAPANLELSVSGGMRYEDNLVVESIDVVSAEKDVALVGGLDLDYEKNILGNSKLRTGYAFSQRLFRQQDDFDLQSHYGFVDLSRELSALTAGAVVDVTYASVGGDSLLDKQGVSGYLSDLATKNVYWKVSVGLDQTNLDSNAGRSNTGQQVDFSTFYFIDGPRQYLKFGYRYSQEQADAAIYDYHANRVNLGYVKRLTVAEDQPVRVRLDWRYELRRYEEFDPALNDKRHDERNRWRLRMDTPISDNLSFHLKYEHRDYSSNNESLDFKDNRIEVSLELQLL